MRLALRLAGIKLVARIDVTLTLEHAERQALHVTAQVIRELVD